MNIHDWGHVQKALKSFGLCYFLFKDNAACSGWFFAKKIPRSDAPGGISKLQNGLCKQEIDQKGNSVHDGGNERACHDCRV